MNFIVYKASAGSGKTYTLVKEYLKLSLKSLESDYYRRILAITFTNKAANEMKERVIRSLKDIAAEKSPEGTSAFLMTDLINDLNLKDYEIRERAKNMLSHILHNYSDLSICTIDKFTHRLIRTFAHDLRLPLNFEVDMDQKNLLSKAVDLLISKIGSDENLTKILLNFAEEKAENEKNWHIEKDLKEFATTLLKDDGSEFAKKLQHLNSEEFFFIKKNIQNAVNDFDNQLTKIGKKALQLIHDNSIDPNTFANGERSGLPKYFTYLANNISESYFPTPSVSGSIANNKWYAGKASVTEKIKIDAIKSDLLDLYQKAINLVNEKLNQYNLLKLINRHIYSLMVINEIEKTVSDLKKENNILHISDFNKLISEVIANEPAPFIYERIGDRYNHYLIDEFQDTSVLQWQNLLPLIDNSLAEGNLNMIVGDGKQSIYRWRGGEVEQFSRLPQIFKKTGDYSLLDDREETLKRNYTEIALENNFRSKREIVEFNNNFFTTVSSSLNPGLIPIYNKLTQNFNKDKTGGLVQIDYIIEGELSKEDFILQNCKMVLERIKELKQEKFDLKDIALLFRTNVTASIVAEYLTENGVDVVSSESLLICNSPEVNLIVTLLQYLSEPDNKIIQATLVKDIFSRKNYTDLQLHEALVEIASGNKTATYFIELTGIEFKPSLLNSLPLFEMCEELCRVFELNMIGNSYMEFFLENIFQYSRRFTSTTSEFLDWWEDNKSKKSVIIPEGVDAVKIMTIHKSKGLEFPVVIFPFANWKTDSNRDSLWIDTASEPQLQLPVAMVPSNKLLMETAFASVYETEKAKNSLDNLNILYVALTRPEERLYIITSKSRNKDLSKYFDNYLKTIGVYEENKTSYTFGEGIYVKDLQKKSGIKKTLKLSFESNSNWYQKIKISAQSGYFEKNASASYGILLHLVLSRINKIEDAETAINSIISEGYITLKEAEGIKEKINKILTHPRIIEWYLPDKISRNESEIILPSGAIYRPDRVLLNGKIATVIDFKTGTKNNKHHKQLNQYAETLLQMGYSAVNKFIVYTETLEVEEIQ
jgi:ATP-dependent exoDNAse (exonuclease V) beta subunit